MEVWLEGGVTRLTRVSPSLALGCAVLSSASTADLDGRKLDVYAFAVLVNALFASQHPFRGLAPMRVIAAVKLEGARPTIATGLPRECDALVRMCWQSEPSLRPNFVEVTRTLRELLNRHHRKQQGFSAAAAAVGAPACRAALPPPA